MPFFLKRVYDAPESSDGFRVLVDRLWPRGIRKDALVIHEWLRDVAPSHELRKWFHRDPSRFMEFADRYLEELRTDEPHRLAVLRLQACEQSYGRVTLVYAARDPVHNHARVLLEHLAESRR
ncbi:DUF488 domain-containing protein [Alicyclobacillus fructus]|uniref:DUF488 domain-containing protein n=1 Tax=Alicyclobacillus fructus TaxID=2816082 RepID=UPI001A90A973|nr:DUF488 family protein [Alicyclobacillus fructus]